MGIHLHDVSRSFELKTWQDVREGEVVRPFADAYDALSFLRGFMHDTFAMAALREVATRGLWTSSVIRCSDQEVLQQLAWKLASGQLCLVVNRRTNHRATGGGAPVVPGVLPVDAPPEPPAPVVPEPVNPTTHWISFQLIDDETDEPIAGVDLRLTLPNGKARTFTTNDQGLVDVVDLPAGSCSLEEVLDAEGFEVVRFE